MTAGVNHLFLDSATRHTTAKEPEKQVKRKPIVLPKCGRSFGEFNYDSNPNWVRLGIEDIVRPREKSREISNTFLVRGVCENLNESTSLRSYMNYCNLEKIQGD